MLNTVGILMLTCGLTIVAVAIGVWAADLDRPNTPEDWDIWRREQ